MKLDPEIKAEVKEYITREKEPNRKVIKRYIERRLEEKRKELLIISGSKLTEGEIDLLLNQFPFLKGKYDKIENKVDAKILAGVIIKFQSKVINLTLESKLQNLKKNLYESS